MGSEWPTGRLGDYVDSCLGKMLDKEKNRGEFYPYLGNKNVRWGSFDLDDLAQMRFEEHEHEKYGLQSGDLVICEGGEPGRCAIWTDQVPNMKIQKALHRVRPLRGLNNYYLHYWFTWAGKNGLLDAYFTGTTIKHLTGKALAELEIPIPPLTDQEYMVRILRSLDDKIELNRQINTTLESMAQALFKSWFVDFDPVIDNALAAGNPIPEPFMKRAQARAQKRQELHAAAQATQSANGSTDASPLNPLPAEIQQLFPSSFVFTEEMGWVPEGWEMGVLEDLLVLQRGFDLPKSDRYDGEFALMAASGQDGTHNEYRVKGPGITTGRSGKLGEVCFVENDFWPLNTTLWVKEFKRSSPYHAYYLLKSMDLEKYNSGSAVPTLNRNYVHNVSMMIPSKKVISAYDQFVSGCYTKKHQNIMQNDTISQIRDQLLPKLLSGKLQLPEAEQQLAEVI